MKILKVEKVSFAYDREPVLKEVSLEVGEREFVAIIGPNGGGKSTLLKLIMGQFEPQSGQITVLGKSPKEAREEIGYVPQNTNVNLEFPIRVLDVVMMGNPKQHREAAGWWERLFPVRYNDIEKRCAYSTLEKVGMEAYMHRRIGDLSGGQRQRVMIARALCAHPRLLILDEPTSSIDVEGQQQIFSLLKELSKDLSILVVSHDLSVITDYADKVVYLNRTAYTHDLRNAPIHLKPPEGDHFCEVELMQMLSQKSCDCEQHGGKEKDS
ncbi:metal ABC transporter ATP-binding protein [Nitratifractor salsuginis]|uniref:ABC transporter related protein n=1 Tax=Nitratifractor salsuginis (strain DSM 16511 / JCM 12458 / E9I37-1) TaxID=749222 RepID=E6X1F9_NITSE|nr:ABC transporter ATP-binding protein [Nitratifractor salsuginis]ADV45892.1 ABC transporter related protein [Nitratifractor salsuginis DSM 16511]